MFPLRHWIRRRNKKAPKPILSPAFGVIHFLDLPGLQFWQSPGTTFWGFEDVELTVRADVNGPSGAQERALVEIRDSKAALLPRCLATLETSLPPAVARPAAPIRLVGVGVPSLREGDDGHTWYLVFEDQYMREFRIESTDAWDTMSLVGYN